MRIGVGGVLLTRFQTIFERGRPTMPSLRKIHEDRFRRLVNSDLSGYAFPMYGFCFVRRRLRGKRAEPQSDETR